MARKRVVGGGEGGGGVAVMEPPVAAVQPAKTGTSVWWVPIADIRRGIPNHRHEHRRDEEALRRLAESMREQGLQQPILLAEADGGLYDLVYGHRRLEAAERLGWTEIKAEVRPPMTTDEVLAVRAIENLHRVDLNVMEQVMAVEHAGRFEGADAEKVAAKLGMSVEWVRDRVYLNERLCAEVKKLALEGGLFLGHLRELAKLGSAAYQAEVARSGSHERTDGTFYVETVDWFKKQVELLRRSLKGVAWHVEVPFAGKPACTGCPHNSATDKLLFQMEDPTARGFCLNGPCFGAKVEAAEKAKAAVIAKLRKKKADPSMENVREAVPEFLRHEPTQRLAKRVLGEGANGKPAAGAGGDGEEAGGGRSTDPSKTPYGKFADAMSRWQKEAFEAVEAGAIEKPMLYAGLALLNQVVDEYECSWFERMNRYDQNVDPEAPHNVSAEDERLLAAAMAADVKGFRTLIEAAAPGYQNPLHILSCATPEVMLRVAKAVGVSSSLKPAPRWEDFAPKAAAEKPAKDEKVKKGKSR